MTVTASMVKELRERTGAGMMECKKALVAAEGDLDVAAENMRKAGLAKADKKAGRVAAEGVVVVAVADDAKRAAIVEINSVSIFIDELAVRVREDPVIPMLACPPELCRIRRM